MQIRARIKKLLPGGPKKAVADVILDDVFVIHNVTVIDGKTGKRFILMPPVDSRLKWNRHKRDVCHPLNNELRMQIQQAVFGAYEEEIAAFLKNAGKANIEKGGSDTDVQEN